MRNSLAAIFNLMDRLSIIFTGFAAFAVGLYDYTNNHNLDTLALWMLVSVSCMNYNHNKWKNK